MAKKTKSKFVKLTPVEQASNKDEVVRLLNQNVELEAKKRDLARGVNEAIKDNKEKITELCAELKRGREEFEGEEKSEPAKTTKKVETKKKPVQASVQSA